MPTGYTAEIERGISFEKFVWSCARQFGALITMRDEPNDAQIPEEFKPSTWNREQLAIEEKSLVELKKLTVQQAEKKAKAEYEEELSHHQEYIAKKRTLKVKYLAMLEQVRAWNPPTPDHQGLRDFMEKQITESIDFDCGTEYLTKPKLLTGKDWLNAKLKKCLSSIEYHTTENAKEEERVAGRNAWVKALRESLTHPT